MLQQILNQTKFVGTKPDFDLHTFLIVIALLSIPAIIISVMAWLSISKKKSGILLSIILLATVAAQADQGGAIVVTPPSGAVPFVISCDVPTAAKGTSNYQWSLDGAAFGVPPAHLAICTITNAGSHVVQCVETTMLGNLTNSFTVIATSTNQVVTPVPPVVVSTNACHPLQVSTDSGVTWTDCQTPTNIWWRYKP